MCRLDIRAHRCGAAVLATVLVVVCSIRAQQFSRPASSHVDSATPSHQLIFSNKELKAFRVQLPARTSTSRGDHAHDCLFIALRGGNLEVVSGQGRYALEMKDGEMQVIKGAAAHRVVNRSDSAADLLEIEVLRDIAPDRAVCGLTAANCGEVRFGNSGGGPYSQTALFETPTVKLLRAELGPGGILPSHAHRQGHLLIALTALRLESEGIELKDEAGGIWWYAGGLSKLSNLEQRESQFLILEFK